MSHPDLAAEQAHVDHAYTRLEAMRAAAADMLQTAFIERGGTFQAVTERDIRVRTSLNRLEQLQLGREALVFGRIDRLSDGRDGAVVPEAFHIGRLAVSDEDQEPLVVDWRAPVAEPFYRATGAHPMGLARRRHFLTDGRLVLDLEDELFGEAAGSSNGAVGLGAGLSGSATLLAALERSRTGRMRDIVATVQREQDEIIRGPLSGVLVVQGGPGTGKTAVALHRAAYLLYTHRFPLEHQGVLVVGPNPLFLRYIEHVLPSLGETGVELSTVGGLFSELTPTGVEDADTARIKGDVRMAKFLARAVASRQRPLRRTVEIPFGGQVLRLTPDDSANIVKAARRRAGTHNARRRYAEMLLWRHLHERYREGLERRGGTGVASVAAAERADGTSAGGLADAPILDGHGGEGHGGEGHGGEGHGGEGVETGYGGVTAEELGRELRRQPAIAQALDRMWPLLTPQQLLRDVFGAPPLIALAADGLLSPAEQARLARDRSDSVETVAWTTSDIPLLDAAAELLGPQRGRARIKGSGESGTTHGYRTSGVTGAASVDDTGLRKYGHIVADEAQDLSPMQLRMLGRRSLSGSITIVGDIAQATGEWAPRSWQDVLAHVPTRRGSRVVELTVNYRTPSEVMELARHVLEAAAPGMKAPESVRATGVPPRVVAVDAVSLAAEVAGVSAEEAAIVTGESSPGGSVGVICPATLLAEVAEALREIPVSFGSMEGGALEDTITLAPVGALKGLEFDSVVVVEPARVVADGPQGLRALYVALTRATRRLTVLHAEPLPEALLGLG